MFNIIDWHAATSDQISKARCFRSSVRLQHQSPCKLNDVNSDSFDENYGLASTQSLKNKDIPEGGAKGTILPSLGANPRTSFEKYVDVRAFSLTNFFKEK